MTVTTTSEGNATPPDNLSLKDGAKAIGVDPKTLTRWWDAGIVDLLQPAGPGTRILVPRDEIARLREHRPVRGAHPPMPPAAGESPTVLVPEVPTGSVASPESVVLTVAVPPAATAVVEAVRAGWSAALATWAEIRRVS